MTQPSSVPSGGAQSHGEVAGQGGLPARRGRGGDFRRFRPLVDLYREAGRRAGHAPGTLRVGVHAFGYVGESMRETAADFFPGYERLMTVIGRERGWAPPSRAAFDAALSPTGPHLIGSVEAVVNKVLYVNEVLGGVDRLIFQMTNVMLPHDRMLRAIEWLGTRVAPLVRERLGSPAALP